MSEPKMVVGTKLLLITGHFMEENLTLQTLLWYFEMLMEFSRLDCFSFAPIFFHMPLRIAYTSFKFLPPVVQSIHDLRYYYSVTVEDR